jgi:hypothetical protein
MYIIQVDDIVCPLFVFKNYGGEGKKATDLFCALPQPNWGQYFEKKLTRATPDLVGNIII